MTRTVLITGTSSGIGNAAVKAFATKNWNVVATMRKPTKDFAGRENVLVTRLDVQDMKSIHDAVGAGVKRFGKIDALINNAGYGQYGVFEATPPEKVREQFDVNVFGVMDITRAILPHFRKNRRGLIINVSSGAGIFTLPMLSLYCASKFALEGFSESLAYELASQNIIVKIVQPHGGVTATNFSERAAQDGAQAAAFPDYDKFAKHTNECFARMRAARSQSSEDVARMIYVAATDGTDQLRYLVGDDQRGFVKARQELSEKEYVAFMRSRFKPHSGPDAARG